MAVTVDWQQDGQQVIIRQGGGALNAARLVGLPFILAGGYFLKIFWGGLMNDELAGVGGWVVLPLLGLAIAFPGFCLMVWRRRATLNNANKEVAEELDFIVFKRRWAAAVSSGSFVRLQYQAIKDTTKSHIHVDIVTPAQRDTMIGLFDEHQKAESLELAKKAAAFLGITVKDRLVEGGTVTSGGVVVDESDPEYADEFEEDEEEEEQAR